MYNFQYIIVFFENLYLQYWCIWYLKNVYYEILQENTIGIEWNYGTGEGQIVLTQYNLLGELECLYVNIQIEEIAPINTFETTRPESLLVYPNPAGSQLNILIDSKSIESVGLYDMSGKTIFLDQAPCFNDLGRLVVDVSEVHSGIYFLIVQTFGGVFVEKVSVKR